MGTVYKTFESFVVTGLIHNVVPSDGLVCYDGETMDHKHIYKSDTEEIIDFKDERLMQLIIKYTKEKEILNPDIKKTSL